MSNSIWQKSRSLFATLSDRQQRKTKSEPARSRIDRLADYDLTKRTFTKALFLRAAQLNDETERGLKARLRRIRPISEPADLQQHIASAVCVVAIDIMDHAVSHAMGPRAFLPGDPLPQTAPVVVMFGFAVVVALRARLRDEGSDVDLQQAAAAFVSAEFLMQSDEERINLFASGAELFQQIAKGRIARQNVREWHDGVSLLVIMYVEQFTTDDQKLKNRDLRPLFGSLLKTILSSYEPPA